MQEAEKRRAGGRAGRLLARGEASPRKFIAGVCRKAAEEMDERIRERLHTEDITARTFHALALHIIQQGSKKVLIVSKLANDTAARHELFIAERRSNERKESAGEGLAATAEEEMQWSVPEGNFWMMKNYSVVLPYASIVG